MTSRFQHATLPNGLTIVAEVDPSAHTAAAGYFVKTGARDEDPSVMGVSHFLEHMMFKGTHDLSADDVNRAFDDRGAKNNAYTTNEMTCFYAHCLPEHLPTINQLLGRMLRPALRESDFDTEKGVILEEIAMYRDNPFWVLYEESVERYYTGHGLGQRVLGTTRTITDLSRDQMLAYFSSRYSPDNMAVALAGRLDFEAQVARIESLCGGWKPTGATRDPVAPAPARGDFTIREAKVGRSYMIAMAPGPSIRDERRYAAALLAQILGASDNSRLHWSLIETGIAEEAQASFDAHDGAGEYMIYASGDPGRAGEILDHVLTELDRLIESITPDDLERLRNKFTTAATLGGERPHDRMHRLGRLWLSLGEYRPLEQELDRINAVTLDELRAVAEAFPIRPMMIGRLLPAAEPGGD
ncbi:MAG: insulinase family protein [Phycisphaeraceae bacterium]|nr:insulinase family protein [Phycisphaerae bacterium]MBX3391455.1 insulinase family protein [Phycisphaeraceae bacterium]